MVRSIAILLAMVLAGSAHAQEGRQSLDFEIPVLPGIARHLELLKVPSYAVLAMENNGLRLSLSSQVVLKGRDTVQMRIGSARFTGTRGDVFLYEGGLSMSFVGGGSVLTVPVEVDTSRIAGGLISVRAFPPLAGFVPQEILDKVEFKIRALANLQTQAQLLTYLDELQASPAVKQGGFESMLEAIVLESYNRVAAEAIAGGRVAGDRGAAESVSDQAFLLVTLAFWLIGFPVFLYILRMRRRQA